jgi:uncharacterized protein (TIGR03790 family)
MPRWFILAFLPAFLVAPSLSALEPDNLLLLVNKNVPESKKLAEYYASKRNVPDGRTLELDLPFAEEISFDTYENQVVPAVRELIASNNLQEKITCLVTFYGVPLKIAQHTLSAPERLELANLTTEFPAALKQTESAVQDVETLAKELDLTFSAGSDHSLPGVIARDKSARNVISREAMKINEPKSFDALMSRAEKVINPLIGDANVAQRRLNDLARLENRLTPQQKKEAETILEQLRKMRAEFEQLQAHRGQPDSRARLRALTREHLGLVEYTRLLEGMLEYFKTDSTGAAFDSELALVNWNFYTRSRWLPNPLRYNEHRPEFPPILMTMRLDGPQAGTARDIIIASLKAEAEGLSGKVVVDAGGNLAIDPKSRDYAAFDQTLRRLADIVRLQSNLPLVFDQRREVLPAHSVQGQVALYCGWYALQNYTPACTFSPGAVGYHIASFELTSLRTQSNQWCRGLLLDGIAATLGPVNEPFLQAFPPPDEFFPLLMTGKYTLAEVYWKTVPGVSWQIAIIGDPLYNPFKARPALAVDALPQPLRNLPPR